MISFRLGLQLPNVAVLGGGAGNAAPDGAYLTPDESGYYVTPNEAEYYAQPGT